MSIEDGAAPGAAMRAEIAEQPDVLARVLEHSAELGELRARLVAQRPRLVMLAGRGTSDHAALYAKYLVETRWELPAGLAAPSIFTTFGACPDLDGVLYVTFSQSGRSPDLVGSARIARECGAVTLAITNDVDSELAAVSTHVVDARAGVEQAVAATKSYTAQLLSAYLLFGGSPEAAAGVPAAVAATLREAAPRAASLAARYRFLERLVVTARGYSYATAREAALKVMETARISAHAYSGADLMHGPLAMIVPEVAVIAVRSPGRGGDALAPVLERLRTMDCDLLTVGQGQQLPVVSNDLDEALAPIAEIVALQQLACEVAVHRGFDPDRPPGLSKVTQTW